MYYLIPFSKKLYYIDETEIIFLSLPHSRYWGLEVLGHVNSVVKSRVFLSHSISVLLSIAPFKKGILELGPLTMAPWEQKRVTYRDLYSHSTKEGSQTNIFWNVYISGRNPSRVAGEQHTSAAKHESSSFILVRVLVGTHIFVTVKSLRVLGQFWAVKFFGISREEGRLEVHLLTQLHTIRTHHNLWVEHGIESPGDSSWGSTVLWVCKGTFSRRVEIIYFKLA